MIENALKQKWAAGAPVLNGWLSIGNAFTAEIMAAQGFDSVTVDIQHGALDYHDMLGMFQAMRASGVVTMARVPWLEPGIIMKAMDAGAFGIICPMVNTRADAERLVSYMRYPPKGTRSFGPTRVNFAAGTDYATHANDTVLCLAMVETAEALENLEEIVTTPGLDGIYVGPADLSIGVSNGRLGGGFDREEEEMIAHLKTIAAAAAKAGIKAGIHCGSPDYAARAIGWGYHLTTLSSDVQYLARGAKAALDRVHTLLGETPGEAPKGSGY